MTERQRERLESESFRTLVQKIRYEDLPKAHKDLADAIGVEDTLKLCELVGGYGGEEVDKDTERWYFTVRRK